MTDELTVARYRMVVCPCCKGERVLKIYDDNYPGDPPVRVMCCHCSGEGNVKAEV